MSGRVLLVGGLMVAVAAAVAAPRPHRARPGDARPSRESASDAAIRKAWDSPLPCASCGLHGYVRDAWGSPVADATVEASAAGEPRCVGAGPMLGRTRTDQDGRFDFDSKPLRGAIRLLARQGISKLAALTVSSPGPHILRFGLEAWIEGAVCDPAGRALAGAQIEARATPRGMTGPRVDLSTQTDRDGFFRLGPIAPGTTAVLEVRASGYRPTRSGAVDLAEGAVARVALTLEPGLPLAGVVRDDEGRPLGGATIEAFQGGGFVFRTASAQDGSFELDGLGMRPGRLFARLEGYEAVTVEQPSSDAVITLRRATELTGRIEPAREGLYAVVTSGGVRDRTSIGADGRFRFARAPRGAVSLEIETAQRGRIASVAIDLASVQGEIVVPLP